MGLVVVVRLRRSVFAGASQAALSINDFLLRFPCEVKPRPLTVASYSNGVTTMGCEAIRGRVVLLQLAACAEPDLPADLL